MDYYNGGPTFERTLNVGGFTGALYYNGSVGSAVASPEVSIRITDGSQTFQAFTWVAYVQSQGPPGIIGSLGRCPGPPPAPSGFCSAAPGYSAFWDAGYQDYSYSSGIMSTWPTALYDENWNNDTVGTWCVARQPRQSNGKLRGITGVMRLWRENCALLKQRNH